MKFTTDQRILIAGQTGSGKTELMKRFFFSHLHKVLLSDPKWEHEDSSAVYCHTPAEVEQAWRRGYNKIIYQAYSVDMEDFEEICYLIFFRGNYTLIIDEVKYCIPNAQTITKWYGNILRLGRGRNIGCITLSQRPMNISGDIISESQHIVAFWLSLEGDRKKLRGVVGEDAMRLNKLPEYHFMTYNPREGVRWYYPIKI